MIVVSIAKNAVKSTPAADEIVKEREVAGSKLSTIYLLTNSH